MTTATLTSKWQITIPSAIRSELHVGAGDRLEFIKIGEGRFEIIAANKDVTSIKGIVKAQKPVSLEAMDAAIKSKVSK
ncbi:MAG: AbrB/MazE/SpoVT family DNA-binding domain-containing protein [Cellvibrio sp.]|uniref:AbrB/MazE/SpoVT family DNA-binding domain-containing protein n=1 Tax=Cellvibrio sp. TaxID=1965322 RepID=UPI0031B2544F